MKRKIPRTDDGNHAQSLAVITAVLIGDVRWQNFTDHARWKSGRFGGNALGSAHFYGRFQACAARFLYQPIDDFIGTLLQNNADALNQGGAFGVQSGCPGFLGGLGALVGGIDIGRVGQLNGVDAFLCIGIDVVTAAAGSTVAP